MCRFFLVVRFAILLGCQSEYSSVFLLCVNSSGLLPCVSSSWLQSAHSSGLLPRVSSSGLPACKFFWVVTLCQFFRVASLQIRLSSYPVPVLLGCQSPNYSVLLPCVSSSGLSVCKFFWVVTPYQFFWVVSLQILLRCYPVSVLLGCQSANSSV